MKISTILNNSHSTLLSGSVTTGDTAFPWSLVVRMGSKSCVVLLVGNIVGNIVGNVVTTVVVTFTLVVSLA